MEKNENMLLLVAIKEMRQEKERGVEQEGTPVCFDNNNITLFGLAQLPP